MNKKASPFVPSRGIRLDEIDQALSKAMEVARLYYTYCNEYSPQLASRLCDCLGISNTSVVSDSLGELKGVRRPDTSTLRKALYRLVVNRRLLRQGIAVPREMVSLNPEWAIVKAIRVQLLDECDAAGISTKVRWRILSGPLVGKLYVQRMNDETAKASYRICAGRPWYCTYGSPKQLYDMYGVMNIGWTNDRLLIERLAVTRELRAKNVRMAELRSRQFRRCRFNGRLDCHLCDVGRNECRESVNHEDTNLIQWSSHNEYSYVVHEGKITPEAQQALDYHEKQNRYLEWKSAQVGYDVRFPKPSRDSG